MVFSDGFTGGPFGRRPTAVEQPSQGRELQIPGWSWSPLDGASLAGEVGVYRCGWQRDAGAGLVGLETRTFREREAG
jgi:hypothetical protein